MHSADINKAPYIPPSLNPDEYLSALTCRRLGRISSSISGVLFAGGTYAMAEGHPLSGGILAYAATGIGFLAYAVCVDAADRLQQEQSAQIPDEFTVDWTKVSRNPSPSADYTKY